MSEPRAADEDRVLDVWSMGKDSRRVGRAMLGKDGLEGLVEELGGKLCTLSPPVVSLRSANSDPLLVLKLVREHSHEPENLQALLKHLKTLDFFSVQLVSVFPTSRGTVLCTKAAAPATLDCGMTVKSLRELLSRTVLQRVSKAELASICAQVCVFLSHMQSSSPQWTHNDFKADNILLSAWPNKKQRHIHFNSLQIDAPFHIVVIDAETIAGEGFKGLGLDSCEEHVLCNFGLDTNTPFSPATDLHLFLLEILFHIDFKSKHKPIWVTDFVVFCSAACPMSMFNTHATGGKYVTQLNRLNADARRLLDSLYTEGKCKSPKDLLSHPFLSCVVRLEDSSF